MARFEQEPGAVTHLVFDGRRDRSRSLCVTGLAETPNIYDFLQGVSDCEGVISGSVYSTNYRRYGRRPYGQVSEIRSGSSLWPVRSASRRTDTAKNLVVGMDARHSPHIIQGVLLTNVFDIVAMSLAIMRQNGTRLPINGEHPAVVFGVVGEKHQQEIDLTIGVLRVCGYGIGQLTTDDVEFPTTRIRAGVESDGKAGKQDMHVPTIDLVAIPSVDEVSGKKFGGQLMRASELLLGAE